MQLLRIPYKTSLPKMLISGILGVWLHISIDGPHLFDVKILWLSKMESLVIMIHRHLEFLVWMIYHHLGLGKEQNICLIFFPAALIAYIFAVRSFSKNRRLQNGPGGK